MQEVVQQISKALESFSKAPNVFRLVIIIGEEKSGKTTLIQYCCGQRYHYQEHEDELEAIASDGSLDDSYIKVIDDIIFFEWQLFQHQSEMEKNTQDFLLAYLLKFSSHVSWVGTISYYDVRNGTGKDFKRFYESLGEQRLITKEIKASIQWVATRIPFNLTYNYSSEHLLKACQKLVPNCFHEMMDITAIDQGESAEYFLKKISTLPSNSITLSLCINTHTMGMLDFSLSNPQYSNVADFFFTLIELPVWLTHCLREQSELNDHLVTQLVKQTALLRIKDPYDNNYQHHAEEDKQSLIEVIDALPDEGLRTLKLKEANYKLKQYKEGACEFNAKQLLEACDRLDFSTDTSSTAPDDEVEILSNSMQATLISSCHQNILEANDTETEKAYLKAQIDSPETQSTTIFDSMLSTFKMVNLLKLEEIQLVQSIVAQFNIFLDKQWEAGDIISLLNYLCALLKSFDVGSTLEQAYLRPLLYLLNESETVCPSYPELPLEKLKK